MRREHGRPWPSHGCCFPCPQGPPRRDQKQVANPAPKRGWSSLTPGPAGQEIEGLPGGRSAAPSRAGSMGDRCANTSPQNHPTAPRALHQRWRGSPAADDRLEPAPAAHIGKQPFTPVAAAGIPQHQAGALNHLASAKERLFPQLVNCLVATHHWHNIEYRRLES